MADLVTVIGADNFAFIIVATFVARVVVVVVLRVIIFVVITYVTLWARTEKDTE